MDKNKNFYIPYGECCGYTCWDCKHLNKSEYKEDVLTLGITSGYWCDAIRSYVKSTSDASRCSNFE